MKNWESEKGSIKIGSEYSKTVAKWMIDNLNKKERKVFDSYINQYDDYLQEGLANLLTVIVQVSASKASFTKACTKGFGKKDFPIGGINRSYHHYSIAATICEMLETGDIS